MANELQKKGAQPSKQPKYGVLWANSFYNGVVTQRNPLRGNAPHIEEEYYGSRYDTMIDGRNCELSTKLTIIRRPGHSVYNSQIFPAINRFYENRTSLYNATQTTTSERIQVIADTASVVYDATGPSTKTALFTKSAGAGSTYFQSGGNSLYFSNGVDNKKLLTPDLIWAANQSFSVGDFIIDPNGNLQVVSLATVLTDTITKISVVPASSPTRYIYTIILGVDSPVTTPVPISLSGLTTLPFLNGTTQILTGVSGTQITFNGPFTSPLALTAETGLVTYGGNPATPGFSGGTTPAWNATPGGTTLDGGLVWQNMGSPVQNWQIAKPTFSPSVSGTNITYWTPNTNFLNPHSAVLDSNGSYQIVWTAGVSGSSQPAWGSVGQYTQDGSVTWYNIGTPFSWQPNTDSSVAGSIHNSQVTWAVVLDSNGNLQIAFSSSAPYMTGPVAPAWATTFGSTTVDADVVWTCCGPGRIVSSGAWQWAYSYHGVDGSITTASPVSTIYTGILGTTSSPNLTITGAGTTDPQCDQIWIWRTVQGGSTLFFDGAVANPGAGTSTATPWTYHDTIPDVSILGGPALDELIEAPIALTSDPPPIGMTALAYHLERIWGAVGNMVMYSDGPDVTSGNGNTAWNPNNFFQFPSSVTRMYPTSNGLIVFTISDVYVIQGLGTPTNSFFSTPFLSGIGLTSYDAFAVNGAIAFLYTSDNQLLTLDPSSGGSEVGAPIGDQFGPGNGTGTFTPSSVHLSWNFAGSQEKALYVSDFTGNWWRMLPTPSPETGITWCPMATIIGGFSAVQSVETAPAVHNLLLGPQTSGPILKRDSSVFTDNGAAYPAYSVIGSIVLAQPGQIAFAEFIATDSVLVGTPLTLAVQLDEIAPLSSGYFEPLTVYEPDPTELEPSNSSYAQRFYLSQTQDPAICRHLQIQVNFGSDTVKNELLSLSIFGTWDQEK